MELALLIKGIDNQFFPRMLKIFEEELKKLEYTFLLHAVGEDQDDVSVAVQLAKEKRLKGYREALADNGIEENENLIRYMKDNIPEYSVANGYEVTKELLQSKEAVDFPS